MSNYHRAILFYNEKSGKSETSGQIETIKEYFVDQNMDLEIVKVPKPPEEMAAIIAQAKSDGVDLILAAGGDGTVSMVGSPLINSDIPLGILPIGTGNLLAKELMIPINLVKALELITSGESETISIDVLKLDDQYYILNISVGVSSRVMKSTTSDEKKRLGVFAYLIHFIQQILGLKLQRFTIDYDGQKEFHLASEVLITNGRLMGVEPLEWSEDISLNDGKLDIFIIRAANILDLISIFFAAFSKRKWKSPVIRYVRFEEYCRIETKDPIQAQADGDAVGKTPLVIQVEPQALTLIIPKKEPIIQSS